MVLMGAGSLEKMIRRLVQEKGLEGRITFLPPGSQKEVARWMNAADCLCLSSALEGMPRVVVEALYCGLPAVSTDVGEVKRLIGAPGTGRLVREQTAQALSQAILQQLDQPPDRQACRRQAQPYVASAVLNRIYDAYRALAGQAR